MYAIEGNDMESKVQMKANYYYAWSGGYEMLVWPTSSVSNLEQDSFACFADLFVLDVEVQPFVQLLPVREKAVVLFIQCHSDCFEL